MTRFAGSAWSTRSAAALGLLALVSGCTVAPHVPPAGRAFDGTYVGDTSLVRGGGYTCGLADLPRELTVTDGRFIYPFQVNPPASVAPMPVRIAADGRFNASMQYGTNDDLFGPRFITPWVTVTGRIANGTLEATESDLRCTRHSVLHRR